MMTKNATGIVGVAFRSESSPGLVVDLCARSVGLVIAIPGLSQFDRDLPAPLAQREARGAALRAQPVIGIAKELLEHRLGRKLTAIQGPSFASGGFLLASYAGELKDEAAMKEALGESVEIARAQGWDARLQEFRSSGPQSLPEAVESWMQEAGRQGPAVNP